MLRASEEAGDRDYDHALEPEHVDVLVAAISDNIKETLATVTTNKLKPQTLGRGWKDGTKKPPPAPSQGGRLWAPVPPEESPLPARTDNPKVASSPPVLLRW